MSPTKAPAKPVAKTPAKKAAAKKPPTGRRGPRQKEYVGGPTIPEWVMLSRPPRIYEIAVIQPDPKRTDVIVGEAIPLLVLQGDRPNRAAQRLGVFPATIRGWLARGISEVARMTTAGEEDPSPEEAAYVWLAMGVLRAEAEWEHWAIGKWQAQFGKDWHAAHAMLKARFSEDWGDSSKVEVSGPGGGPVRVANVPTLDEVAAMLAQDEAASIERRRAVEGREVE